MCGDHGNSSDYSASSDTLIGPGDWQNLTLPPSHVLQHLTDAHCHPTDLNYGSGEYDQVQIGAIAAMATDVENQDKVKRLGNERAWRGGCLSARESREGAKSKGTSVVTCFGYHPWFVHRYTLLETPPSKEDHYLSLFFSPKSSPTSKDRLLLTALLPYLPDPIPFAPLLTPLRTDLSDSLAKSNLTMLGEVGIDGQARMRWPTHAAARALYEQQYGADKDKGKREGDDDELDWRRLTPFKTNMAHQKRILELQMEVAIDLGVNASVHSVAAPGATLDVLVDLRKRHGPRFSRTNICIHSAGGWSPDFWRSAALQLSHNLYGSPSILITGRVAHADALIREIARDRILIESDSHDIRQMTRLLWGAAEWVARCKGWKLEGRASVAGGKGDGDAEAGQADGKEGEDWEMCREEEEVFGPDGREVKIPDAEVWTVRTLERNWARFMRLVD